MQINLLYMQSFTDSTFVTLLKSGEKVQLGFVFLNFHLIINFAALTATSNAALVLTF